MKSPLSEEDLDERLWALGLVRDSSTRAPPPSKNRTVVCRQGRKRMLVKVADGPGNVGVLREGSVLQRIAPLAKEKGSPLFIPRIHRFDAVRGLLSLHWLKGGETLHDYHRRTREYPLELAAQIGRALGFLHQRSREAKTKLALADGFRDESDLIDCFLKMRPEFYARLSQVGIDFFGRVQKNPPAMAGLELLKSFQQRESDAVLLHGDLRQANLLRISRVQLTPVVYLDWEQSFWGDSARDIGSLLADYVLQWLAPEHPSEVIARNQMTSFNRSLMDAYGTARGPGFVLSVGFQERVVRWMGAALLIGVYGISHYEQTLDSRAQSVASHALDMVGTPQPWPHALWGGKP